MQVRIKVSRMWIYLSLTMGLATSFASYAVESLYEKTAENLMAVLRTSEGANRSSDKLVPTGTMIARLPSGEEIEMKAAHFEYVGDTHVRFVFDGAETMVGAPSDILSQFGLTTDEGLALAIKNIRKAYGRPKVTEVGEGIFQIEGSLPFLNSSFFLDAIFWQSIDENYPAGVVVAVPARSVLLLTSRANEAGVAVLRSQIRNWYLSAGHDRVSSALYTRRSHRWVVLQEPAAQ